MGYPRRYAARRDQNESELISIARSMGARFEQCGPLDFWMHHVLTGWVPVEIKTPKGTYTPSQKDFLQKCAAWKMPVMTWRTRNDVITALKGYDPWALKDSTSQPVSNLSQGCGQKPPESLKKSAGRSKATQSLKTNGTTEAVKLADLIL